MYSFSIKDFIDILCVALIMFYIYRLMKSTRSANVFSGIIMFIVMWLIVSRVIGMRLLGSIMDQVVNIGVIALVILFQEDIRHFFSDIGTHRSVNFAMRLFQNRKNKAEQNPHIMPLVRACMNMSKGKVGALIIIERNVGLLNEMKDGENINANISQRLIENIFFKNSPLHDGALIISNHRLAAAACVLPVSHDPNIPKNLGLRHRSGIGMSEKSDCLSIMVSEETGNISVAVNGILSRKISGEQLENILREKWK